VNAIVGTLDLDDCLRRTRLAADSRETVRFIRPSRANDRKVRIPVYSIHLSNLVMLPVR